MGKTIAVAARGTQRRIEPRAPSLARADLVGKAVRDRLSEELDAALKRRSASEAKLAGALRALGPLSPHVRDRMADAATVIARRGSYGRELWTACIRTLADARDARASDLTRGALAAEGAGGAATLGAACALGDRSLGDALAKIAASRASHLAFAAEAARVVRGEANGAHLASIAPMIKEAHRIALCLELFVPLARGGSVPLAIAPALAVLRAAERHLGRWLVLAEVAAKAGDGEPRQEAATKANLGPQSSRAAWSLVEWALADATARREGRAPPAAPATRPTVELIARLSDRPSADRDPAFLFRLAASSAPTARAMLESLARAATGARGAPADEVAVRAALYLAKNHGRDDLRQALEALSRVGREDVRGLAAAALWDLSMHAEALAAADELVTSRQTTNVAWSALVRAAAQRRTDEPLVTETSFRWVQWGWLD